MKKAADTMEGLKEKSPLFQSYSNYFVKNEVFHLSLTNLMPLRLGQPSAQTPSRRFVWSVFAAVKALALYGSGFYLADVTDDSFVIDPRTDRVLVSGKTLTEDPQQISCPNYDGTEVKKGHGCAVLQLLSLYRHVGRPGFLKSREQLQLIEKVRTGDEEVVGLIDLALAEFQTTYTNYAEANGLASDAADYFSKHYERVLVISEESESVTVKLDSSAKMTFVIAAREIGRFATFYVCHLGKNCVDVRRISSRQVYLASSSYAMDFFLNVKIESVAGFSGGSSVVYLLVEEVASKLLPKWSNRVVNVFSQRRFFLTIYSRSSRVFYSNALGSRLELQKKQYDMTQTVIDDKSFYEMDVYAHFVPWYDDTMGFHDFQSQSRLIRGSDEPKFFYLVTESDASQLFSVAVSHSVFLDESLQLENTAGMERPIKVVFGWHGKTMKVSMGKTPMEFEFFSGSSSKKSTLPIERTVSVWKNSKPRSLQYLWENANKEDTLSELYELDGEEDVFACYEEYDYNRFRRSRMYFESSQAEKPVTTEGNYYITLRKFPFTSFDLHHLKQSSTGPGIYFMITLSEQKSKPTTAKLTVFACLSATVGNSCHVISKDLDLKIPADPITLEMPAFVQQKGTLLSDLTDVYEVSSELMIKGADITDVESASNCYPEASNAISKDGRWVLKCSSPGFFSRTFGSPKKLPQLPNACDPFLKGAPMYKFCKRLVI